MVELENKQSWIYLTPKSAFSITVYYCQHDTKQYVHLRTNVYNQNFRHLHNIDYPGNGKMDTLKCTTLNLVFPIISTFLCHTYKPHLLTQWPYLPTHRIKFFCAEPETSSWRFSSMGLILFLSPGVIIKHTTARL